MYIFLAKRTDPSNPSDLLHRAVSGYSVVRNLVPELSPKLTSIYFLSFQDEDYAEWDMLEPGDFLLLHDEGSIVAAGKIEWKRQSESLSSALWPGTGGHHNDLIVSTSHMRGAALSLSELEKTIQGKLPERRLQRLTHLTDIEAGAIKKEYSSLEHFISFLTDDDEFMPDIAHPDPEYTEAIVIPGSVELPMRRTFPTHILDSDDVGVLEAKQKGSPRSSAPEPQKTLQDDELRELQRIAKLFDAAQPKDLVGIDRITRDKKMEVVVQEFSARNENKRPDLVAMQITKIKRDVGLVRALKKLYKDKCQICGFTFKTSTGDFYSEAAHITPISSRGQGVDTFGNILVLCANHHKMLDHGVIQILSKDECVIDGKRRQIFQLNLEKFTDEQNAATNAAMQSATLTPTFTRDSDGNVLVSEDQKSSNISQEEINRAASFVVKNRQYWPKGRGRR